MDAELREDGIGVSSARHVLKYLYFDLAVSTSEDAPRRGGGCSRLTCLPAQRCSVSTRRNAGRVIVLRSPRPLPPLWTDRRAARPRRSPAGPRRTPAEAAAPSATTPAIGQPHLMIDPLA